MDMWLRIALQGDVAGIHRSYVLYRQHSNSETNRLVVSGDNIRERVLLTLVNYKRLRIAGWKQKADVWREEVAQYAATCAWLADRAGCTRGRLSQAAWVFRLTPGGRSFWFLAKSWLKHQLCRSRRIAAAFRTDNGPASSAPAPILVAKRGL
jgi:hypothetical protein